MRSSDTPASRRPHDDPGLVQGEQGPTDWTQEPRFSERLSAEAQERLEQAAREWHERHQSA
jgi:hypothetical protein